MSPDAAEVRTREADVAEPVGGAPAGAETVQDSAASTTVQDSAAAFGVPPLDRPLPGLRLWFGGYLAWLAGLTAVALLLLPHLETEAAGVRGLWMLALMAFYLSLCNLFMPLPTAWIILFAASPDGGVFDLAWQRVLAVALVGAVATAVANLNEYHVLWFLFGRGLGNRIRRSRVYRWAVRWFDVAPFQVLALIGFIPVPIDAIRWLAILQRYSRWRFGLAYFTGRGLRYMLFAGFAVLVQLSGTEILALQVGLVLAALLLRLAWPLITRRRVAAEVPAGHSE